MEYVELKDSEERQYDQELRYLDESNQSSIYSEIDADDFGYNQSELNNKTYNFQGNIASPKIKNRSKITREQEPIDVEPLDNLPINESQDSKSKDKELLDIEDPW